jgi:group I intron endonuclease
MVIYSITNLLDGKRYIGQTIEKNPHDRYCKHKYELKKNVHSNSKLQNAWNKYGQYNFIFCVIEECANQLELDSKEAEYIIQFNSIKAGYNIRFGGCGKGITSEETKAKLSKINKGRKFKPLTSDQKIQKSLRARPQGYPLLLSPDGEEYNIVNMKEHCRIFSLDERHMQTVLTGKKLSHKGWKLKNTRPAKVPNGREYPDVISPDGIIYETINLSEFCRQHSLQRNCMRRLIEGKIKKKSYKGWKLV